LDYSQSTRVTDGQTDGQTDRRTDGQNYDSQDRASIAASRGKKHYYYTAYSWISTVDVINIAADRQKFMTLTGELVDSA